MEPSKYCAKLTKTIKETSPLIHNITNFVVMNSSANILLAAGASPVMAHSIDEVKDMASIADALVLNIGTLDKSIIESMILAGKAANKKNIPVILDPVGSGATPFRTDSVKRILNEVNVSVLRGNPSEIFSISQSKIKTRGVDSTITEISTELLDILKETALSNNIIIAASGKTDIVTNGNKVFAIDNGHPVMTKITGMGCGLSSVTGAFCAVAKKDEYLEACASAFAYYGVCGDLTSLVTTAPGSFSVKFNDFLYNVSQEQIESLAKISILQ